MYEKLRRELAKLAAHKGRHTELVTVYIPAGSNILASTKQLEQEKSTAANIKSKSTRKNVIDALEKILRELKGLKKTPENGLAVFSGNISRKEGQTDIQFFAIEPPLPLNVKTYRCDQRFQVEPLVDLVEKREKFGLLVIDRKEATLGLLEGKSIIPITNMTSGVPGKTTKGGSSAARYARYREFLAKEFFMRVAETTRNEFKERNIKGLIIGGPGPTKETFLKETDLGPLKEKILSVEDIGETDESGLKQLVNKASKAIADEEITAEKNLLKKFFKALAKSPKDVTYSQTKVKKAIELGAVENLLISTALDEKKSEQFEKLAAQYNIKLTYVSTSTEEGEEFKNISKVGAFLRFPIE